MKKRRRDEIESNTWKNALLVKYLKGLKRKQSKFSNDMKQIYKCNDLQ